MIKNVYKKHYFRYNSNEYPNTRSNRNNTNRMNIDTDNSSPPTPQKNTQSNPSTPPYNQDRYNNQPSSPSSPLFNLDSTNLSCRETRLVLGVNIHATKREIILRYCILSRK